MSAPSPIGSDPRPRLHFLDGLRGLASFYVLLFHESTIKLAHGSPSRPMELLRLVLSRGHFSVVFFIVLSGYSLMLPLARRGSSELVGFGDYLFRRARRILPPYYAALALSIAVLLAYNVLGSRLGLGQKVDDAALSPGSLLSHLFLVHNLSFDWAYRINGPMWSVATEWQIYFVFPLLLLPVLRRTGAAVMVALAWLVFSLPHLLLPADKNEFWACPWFVGSFALGMWGALIAFSPAYAGSALRRRTPWGWLTLANLLVLVVLTGSGLAETWPFPVVDLFVSLFAFCWINCCALRAAAKSEQGDAMLRVLGSKAMIALGGFSYSLYLIQHPILRLTEKALAKLPLGADAALLTHLLFGTPVLLALAWVFAELFEKPFTTGSVLWALVKRRAPAPAAALPVGQAAGRE